MRTRQPCFLTYTDSSGNQCPVDLRKFKKIKSRESLGVWVIGDRVWKVYSNKTQWERVCREYKMVEESALLVPNTSWFEVEVHYDDITRPTDGFAIISRFINNKEPSFHAFDLKKGIGSLKSVIKKINDIETLKKFENAFQGAKALNISDPQGFIDTTPRSYNPVMFIDIHLHTAAVWSIEDMCDFLEERIREKS